MGFGTRKSKPNFRLFASILFLRWFLKATKSKMQQEWIGTGCRLAWLINPQGQTVHIYREKGEIQIVSGFDKKLSGENVLEGFELDLSPLKI